MKYKINEIFYSLQGEGKFTGTPAIFIRFAFCNLKCSFCDTKFDTYTDMPLEDINKQITAYPSKIIVLTGGEPTLQIDEALISTLHLWGYQIHIESNGTNYIDLPIDWITISPKENWKQKWGSELKVVYTGQNLSQYDNCTFNYYYLQPCSMSNIKETIEVCLKNPKWNLSFQTQKILKIQ